ncbi:MAG: ATP-binding cassette domain-containing protein [Spirochaetes bacterium]|nr:ATP-binding cassette domain-containing protein [Spirochaetota bacterium]
MKGKKLFTLAGSLMIVACWTGLSFIMGRYIIPRPWSVLAEAARLLRFGNTWENILVTLLRVCLGFAAGFFSGFAVGIAAGRSKRWEHFFRPLILLFQGIPPILWAIPLILVFGIGSLSPITVIALICFPLVAVNISEGIGTIPAELEEMVGVFAPGIVPRMREVVLPHLRPFLASSLKLGVTLGIKASVVAEYFGANNGIGFEIQSAFQSLQIKRLFAWGIILVLLIVLVSRAVTRSENGSSGGRRKAEGQHGCGREALTRLFLLSRHERPLAISGLTFGYPDAKTLIKKVNLKVGIRETAVISGESGVGKTTLLKLVASILRPDSGRISGPARIGFVFQDDRLIPWRNIAKNVALPLRYRGYSARESESYARQLLFEAGLSGKGDDLPEELSGGMRKRAALARCFASLPELILFDEPMTGLHREARQFLWKKFFSLLALYPVPVIIVTHFPEEVEAFPHCSFYRLHGSPASLVPEASKPVNSTDFPR